MKNMYNQRVVDYKSSTFRIFPYYGSNFDFQYLSIRTFEIMVAQILTIPRMIVARFESMLDPESLKIETE